MLDARPVTKDLQEVFKSLRVFEHQSDFVASNEKTLRQMSDEPGAEVFGLWLDDQPVGMMGVIDVRLCKDLEPGDDPNTAFLWRLMISREMQGRGLGRAALDLFEAWARRKGLSRLETSVVPENAPATILYEKFGFSKTGEMRHGEYIMVRPAH